MWLQVIPLHSPLMQPLLAVDHLEWATWLHSLCDAMKSIGDATPPLPWLSQAFDDEFMSAPTLSSSVAWTLEELRLHLRLTPRSPQVSLRIVDRIGGGGAGEVYVGQLRLNPHADAADQRPRSGFLAVKRFALEEDWVGDAATVDDISMMCTSFATSHPAIREWLQILHIAETTMHTDASTCIATQPCVCRYGDPPCGLWLTGRAAYLMMELAPFASLPTALKASNISTLWSRRFSQLGRQCGARSPGSSLDEFEEVDDDDSRAHIQRVESCFWLQAKILHQTLSALATLHEISRVAHRDIKPANFLARGTLSAGGSVFDESFSVYLADFGLAKSVDADPAARDGGVRDTRPPLKHTVAGTLAYCPPELLEVWGSEEHHRFAYDATKSDVWSLGAVFYGLWVHGPVDGCVKGVIASPHDAHRIVEGLVPSLASLYTLAGEEASDALTDVDGPEDDLERSTTVSLRASVIMRREELRCKQLGTRLRRFLETVPSNHALLFLDVVDRMMSHNPDSRPSCTHALTALHQVLHQMGSPFGMHAFPSSCCVKQNFSAMFHKELVILRVDDSSPHSAHSPMMQLIADCSSWSDAASTSLRNIVLQLQARCVQVQARHVTRTDASFRDDLPAFNVAVQVCRWAACRISAAAAHRSDDVVRCVVTDASEFADHRLVSCGSAAAVTLALQIHVTTSSLGWMAPDVCFWIREVLLGIHAHEK